VFHGLTLTRLFYLVFTLVQNFAIHFWKLSVFVYRTEILEILFSLILILSIAKFFRYMRFDG